MNIKHIFSGLKGDTESFIEISDHHVSKAIPDVLLINSSPHKKSFELADIDRLDSIISKIKELKDVEINNPDQITATTDVQILSISVV